MVLWRSLRIVDAWERKFQEEGSFRRKEILGGCEGLKGIYFAGTWQAFLCYTSACVSTRTSASFLATGILLRSGHVSGTLEPWQGNTYASRFLHSYQTVISYHIKETIASSKMVATPESLSAPFFAWQPDPVTSLPFPGKHQLSAAPVLQQSLPLRFDHFLEKSLPSFQELPQLRKLIPTPRPTPASYRSLLVAASFLPRSSFLLFFGLPTKFESDRRPVVLAGASHFSENSSHLLSLQ